MCVLFGMYYDVVWIVVVCVLVCASLISFVWCLWIIVWCCMSFSCVCCVFACDVFHVSVGVVCDLLCGVVWFVFVCVVFASLFLV